jgi:hypothetical protein
MFEDFRWGFNWWSDLLDSLIHTTHNYTLYSHLHTPMSTVTSSLIIAQYQLPTADIPLPVHGHSYKLLTVTAYMMEFQWFTNSPTNSMHSLHFNDSGWWPSNTTFLHNCSRSLYPTNSVQVKVILQLTVSRPVCPGVRKSSGIHDQFFFPFLSFFRQLWAFYYGAPSLTRGQVCNLQSITFNCFKFEAPLIWRLRFPYLLSPGTG